MSLVGHLSKRFNQEPTDKKVISHLMKAEKIPPFLHSSTIEHSDNSAHSGNFPRKNFYKNCKSFVENIVFDVDASENYW